MRVIDDAVRHADALAARTGQEAVVYYVAGPDQWGRSAVFYVRSGEEPKPYGSEVVYRTALYSDRRS